jgi:hypothetical protein
MTTPLTPSQIGHLRVLITLSALIVLLPVVTISLTHTRGERHMQHAVAPASQIQACIQRAATGIVAQHTDDLQITQPACYAAKSDAS